MRILLKICAIALITLGFSACGGGMPACDSGEVKKEILAVLKKRYSNLDFKIKLTRIATWGVDKDAKRVTCRADTNIYTVTSVFYVAQRTNDGKLIVQAEIW